MEIQCNCNEHTQVNTEDTSGCNEHTQVNPENTSGCNEHPQLMTEDTVVAMNTYGGGME